MSPKTNVARARREDQEEVLARFEKLAGGALKATLNETDRAKELRAGMRAVGETVDDEDLSPEMRARRRAEARFRTGQTSTPPGTENPAASEPDAPQSIGLVQSGDVSVAEEEQDPTRALLREYSLPSDPEAQRVRRDLQMSEIRAAGPLAAAAAQIGDLTRDSIRSVGDATTLAVLGAAFDGVTSLAGRATEGAATALGADADVADMARSVAEYAIRKGVKPALLASVAGALAA